jgi:hypothetical protein
VSAAAAATIDSAIAVIAADVLIAADDPIVATEAEDSIATIVMIADIVAEASIAMQEVGTGSALVDSPIDRVKAVLSRQPKPG